MTKSTMKDLLCKHDDYGYKVVGILPNQILGKKIKFDDGKPTAEKSQVESEGGEIPLCLL